MAGPGEYVSDVTEGITRVEDLPRAKIKRHSLTPSEKKIFVHVTRGSPNLRNLRSIMDQVCRLCDRRCRTETALEKLAKLRRRVRRFKTLGDTLKKLFTPNMAWPWLNHRKGFDLP